MLKKGIDWRLRWVVGKLMLLIEILVDILIRNRQQEVQINGDKRFENLQWDIKAADRFASRRSLPSLVSCILQILIIKWYDEHSSEGASCKDLAWAPATASSEP